MATTWKTARSGDWSNPERWLGGLPDAATDAAIDVAGSYQVTISTAAAARSLRISGAGVMVAETAGGVLAVSGRITVADGAALTLLGTNPDLARSMVVTDATLHLGGTAALGPARLTLAGASTLLLDGPTELAGRVALGSEDVAPGVISILPENHADLTFSGALTIASDIMVGMNDYPLTFADVTLAPRTTTVTGSHTLEVGTFKTLVLGSSAGAALFDASNGGPKLGLKLDSAARLDLAGHSLTVGSISTASYSQIVNTGRLATLTFDTPGRDIQGAVVGRIDLAIASDTRLPGELTLKGARSVSIGAGLDVELGTLAMGRHGTLAIGEDAQILAYAITSGATIDLPTRTHFVTSFLRAHGDLVIGEDATLVVDTHGGGVGQFWVDGDLVLAAGSSATVSLGLIAHLTGSGSLSASTLRLYSSNGYTGAISITGGNAQLNLAGSDLAGLSIKRGAATISGIDHLDGDFTMSDGQLNFDDLTLSGKITLTGEDSFTGPSLLLAPDRGSSLAGSSLYMSTPVTLGNAMAADLIGQASSSRFIYGLQLNGHDADLTATSGAIFNNGIRAALLTVHGDVTPNTYLGVGDNIHVRLDASGYWLGGDTLSVEMVRSGTIRLAFTKGSLALDSSAAIDIGLDVYLGVSPNISGFTDNDSLHLLDQGGAKHYALRYESGILYVDLQDIGRTESIYIDGDHTLADFAIERVKGDLVITLRGAAGLVALGDDVFETGAAAYAGSLDHHAVLFPHVDLAVLA